MRYINTIDDTIQFIDVDNTITNVPVNGVYTFIKGDTISFILLRRLDNEGYCVMTTRASDVEINGTVYSIDDYIDGTATQDLYTATGLRYEVVEELPDEGQNGVIYLVPNEDDTYDEYIWLEDEERFERVGNTDVDLSDYYTKEEVDTLLANYVTSTVFNNLVDEVEENGRVTAAALVDLDETKQDVISDLATIRSGAAAGATALQSSDLNGYATETYVNNAIAQIPQPDLSAYATVVDVEELEEGSAAALNDLNDRVDTIAAALNNISIEDIEDRLQLLESYHIADYIVTLTNVNDSTDKYTLDEDIITENIPQSTDYRINVARQYTIHLTTQNTSDTGINPDCVISLEMGSTPIPLNNYVFTTAALQDAQYTLTIEVDGLTLDYDFATGGV